MLIRSSGSLPALLVLAALAGVPAAAQQRCEGPPEIERAIEQAPSAGAYNAKGGFLAQQGDLPCALRSFRKALELDPNHWEANFNLALAYLRMGRPQEALPRLQKVGEVRPEFLPGRLALASVLAESGDLEAAAREFQGALDSHPTSTQALHGLAKIRMTQRRYSAAISYLERALEADPANPEYQLMLGVCHSENGETEKAIAVLGKLVEARPDDFGARFNLATVFAKAERYPEAAKHYQEALRINPSSDVARLSAAKALVNIHEYERALELVERWSESWPPSVDEFELRHVRGTALRGLGEYAKAEAELRRAVALRPDHADSHYNLGFALARLKKLEAAREHLERAKELDPESADIRFQLGRVLQALQDRAAAQKELAKFQESKRRSRDATMAESAAARGNAHLKEGNYEAARREYQQAIEHNPADARLYYDISLAYAGLGDRAAQIRALEKAVEIDPKLARAQNELGIIYMDQGRLEAAGQAFQAAIDEDPQYAEAHNNLGVLYGRQGKNAAAEPLFRRAIEDDPDYVQAYVNLGLTLAALNRFKEAEEALREAEKLAPGDERALTSLGMVLTRQGRPAEALERFQKVVEFNPDSAEAHLNLGIALADKFDLEGALEQFTAAAELGPDSPAARYNRGRALFDLKRYEPARRELQKAVELAPQHPHALYLLAMSEKQLGNEERAVRLLKRMVQNHPGDANGHYQLGQLMARLEGPEAAIPHWKQAVQADPQHGEALYNLFRALRKSNPDEARRFRASFEELQKKRRVSDRADTLGNFALSSAAARDWEKAVSQLKEAIEVCGDCPTRFKLHKTLGLIYARSGELEKAEAALKTADRIEPGDPEVRESLAKIADLRAEDPASGKLAP